MQLFFTVKIAVATLIRIVVRAPRGRLLAPCTCLLAGMGILDLTMTVCLLTYTEADEANPLMARFLAMGIGPFIAAKLVSLLFPLGFLEFARRRHPGFVQRASVAGIAGYCVLLAAGIAQANYPQSNRPDLDDEYVNARIAAAKLSRERRKGLSLAVRRIPVRRATITDPVDES